MGVDHRRVHIPVARELLHGPDVVSAFQQMRRKAVAKRVARRPLGQSCPRDQKPVGL